MNKMRVWILLLAAMGLMSVAEATSSRLAVIAPGTARAVEKDVSNEGSQDKDVQQGARGVNALTVSHYL